MKTNKIIIALIGLASLLGVHATTQAGVLGNEYPICSLAIFPYWPEAQEIIGTAGNTYLNFRDDLCSANLKYPATGAKSYPQSELTDSKTPLKSNAIGKKVPIGYHEHSYYNDSVDDDKYYKAFVKSFQITLQPDAVENIDKFYCDYPYPGNGFIPPSYQSIVPTPSQVKAAIGDVCQNWKGKTTTQTGKINNLWGGTKIVYSPGNRTITWTFGVDKMDWLPVFYGDNDGVNPSIQDNYFDNIIGLDTNNDQNRKFTFSIDLETKNQSTKKSIWAATTTSKVLLRNMGVSKSVAKSNAAVLGQACNAPGAYSTGWCSLPVPSGETQVTSYDGKTLPANFFWYDIGSVVSIWKSPTVETPKLACADLQWDGPFKKKGTLGFFVPDMINQNALLPNEAAIMKFITIYESGTGDKRPLEYRWTSFYGDQNRPGWFLNQDGLFGGSLQLDTIEYVLQSSLPYRLLQIAHAAPADFELSESASIGPASAASAAQTLAMIKLGEFKDEISAVLSGNPLTDTDNQIYYSGGSEGVTVGVQAFYADGQNVPGDGPMVNTPDGQKQKANPCHLELVIQPEPVTCIDLSISPSELQPNTPVTFTVTPKFDPSNKTIPLNYIWNAEDAASAFPELDMVFNPGIIGQLVQKEDSTPSWVDRNLQQATNTGVSIIDLLTNPCANGACEEEETLVKDPIGPIGPVEQKLVESFSNMSTSPTIENTFNAEFGSTLGANIFAAEAAQAAQPGVTLGDSMTMTPNLIGTQESTLIPYGSVSSFGGFKDSEASNVSPANPFTETVDNKTYYTGGPGGTWVNVEAVGKDGTIYPACDGGLVIPELEQPICELLKIKFMNENTEVAREDLAAGTTYTIEVDQAASVKDDGTPIENYTIYLYNPTGMGVMEPAAGNPAGCSPIVTKMADANGNIVTIGTSTATPVACKYTFTPNPGDTISILAEPHDNVAECRMEKTIPDVPTTPICKNLNLVTTPLILGNEIQQGQLVGLDTNPIDTDNVDREPVVYSETGNGGFIANPANAASCPAASETFEADSTCKYSYQAPSDGSAATMSVKVKEDDGVPECIAEFVVPEAEDEICLALNLRVNGQYTLTPDIEPGQSYLLQAEPITTQGNLISMVEWVESGEGKLIGTPSNPAICPAMIDDGAVVTLSVCQYIYASPADAEVIGFAVNAVPSDGVAACMASAVDFTPPEEETPYCLYLDLDYTPEPFNPFGETEMNATVVLSDGSKYEDMVRFTSTNGEGRFSGGYGSTSGNNTSSFRTETDNTNNTRTVDFTDGDENSGINVFLSDTDIAMSAACQRQLRPVPEETPPCTIPPIIERQGGNEYCALYGDSESYCWIIEGTGDLMFTTGSNRAIGDCVELEEDYTVFELLVEDCNPEYRDYCFDRIENDETPDIEKRISKDSNPLRYVTQVNFSTTGEQQEETVHYQLTFNPSNFQGDNNYMSVKIYDPAFTGRLDGIKTSVDGTESTGGYIEFDMPDDISIDGYSVCADGASRIDKCFRVNESEGYLEIQGIDSEDPIEIEYFGQLYSGITLEDCRTGEWCNERYENQSKVTDFQFCYEETDSEGNTYVVCEDLPVEDIESNTTVAEIVCSYFLTRASGDIFLEDDLEYGIDVSKCYPFKNISSTVVKPVTPIEGELASTGTPEVISISHEICSAGQEGFENLSLKPEQIASLKELFGADISKLSSQICEVGLVPGSEWNKESINASIRQNLGKLTRWSSPINPSNALSSADLTTIANKGGIYYYNGNLPGAAKTVTVSELKIPEGSGAITLIVENADLQINGNIEYTEGTPAETANDIASLGVIVINGNMYLDPSVNKLAGAYFISRDKTDDYTVGNVISGTSQSPGQDSTQLLTVNGSIYGNIGPLFEHRTAAGDITKDEGAITIRYDQRIIQNPPAGLSELLGDLSQSQVAQ